MHGIDGKVVGRLHVSIDAKFIRAARGTPVARVLRYQHMHPQRVAQPVASLIQNAYVFTVGVAVDEEARRWLVHLSRFTIRAAHAWHQRAGDDVPFSPHDAYELAGERSPSVAGFGGGEEEAIQDARLLSKGVQPRKEVHCGNERSRSCLVCRDSAAATCTDPQGENRLSEKLRSCLWLQSGLGGVFKGEYTWMLGCVHAGLLRELHC
mmetsp:Transcript_11851/g.28322  ORF Transcript_11851/g.28322 Transcript_11851/m.28322 type:complete len:208 (-) Transcript_11851:14-637(-)